MEGDIYEIKQSRMDKDVEFEGFAYCKSSSICVHKLIDESGRLMNIDMKIIYGPLISLAYLF